MQKNKFSKKALKWTCPGFQPNNIAQTGGGGGGGGGGSPLSH